MVDPNVPPRPTGPPLGPPGPPPRQAPPAPPGGNYPPPPPPHGGNGGGGGHDGGHDPLPPGLPEPGTHGSGSAASNETRKPMPLWDRSKFLLLTVLLFWFFVWSALSDPNPFNSLGDAVDETVRSKWWLFAVFGVELVRQVHYVMAERSARYHAFWNDKVFGRVEKRTGRMNDWNRYRLARAGKLALLLAVLSLVLAAVYDVAPVTALFELPVRLWEWLPMILRLASYALVIVVQFGFLFWFLSRGGVETYMPEEIKTRFTDVWGQDPVLERVKENLVFLDRPEAIEEKGGYVPGGILLWGPPGTGKTLMAEAVAGETGKPYVFVDPGAFIQMFMGVGILKVKSLFRKLRKLSLRYGGVIVFFDEADSLGNRGALAGGGQFAASRTTRGPWDATAADHTRWLSPTSQSLVMRSSLDASSVEDRPPRMADYVIMGMGGGGGTLQALLSEMSGLKKPRGMLNRFGRRLLGMRPKPPPKYRIMIMMATNMPDTLDEAMLRPGRIDRIYKVGYPSKEGRKRTYEGYLAKVEHQLTDADIEKLATMTAYATGASMKDLVNEALIIAIRDGRQVITWPDIIKARHLKRLGPPEDVEFIARERHAIAVHEACHAVAAYRVRHHMEIDLATIEPGGTYLGMVASVPPEDQFNNWRSEKEADILVSLASLAGERLFFDGDSSAGVRGDLDNATTVATQMEGYWGMGQTLASHGVTHKIGIGGGGPKRGDGDDESERDLLKGSLGERIEEKLREIYERAQALLEGDRASVLRVAHSLESHKTISGEDLIAVINGTRGPLVDGRVYHEEGFVESLEEYHRMVLDAHRSHGAVTIELPEAIEADAVPQAQPVPALPYGQAYPPPYGQRPYPPTGGQYPQPPYPPPPPNGH